MGVESSCLARRIYRSGRSGVREGEGRFENLTEESRYTNDTMSLFNVGGRISGFCSRKSADGKEGTAATLGTCTSEMR